jgi:predicted lipoprotein with Yx(FWY)xxD motif
MRPLHVVVMGAIGLAFVAAGCGGAIPSSNGGPAMVKMTSSSEGRVLVDAQGRSLYLFDKDERGESYCSGACAAVWPPFETDSTPRAAGGLSSAALGTVKRDDGDLQVTYHGHPLYYYAADASTPGRTKGEEVDQFGAAWYLVDPQGKAVEASASHSNSDTTSGGGGY